MSGFRQFIARGNVIDLAVAVIIGAAFTSIVTSLTGDVIMPIVGKLTGDIDFSRYYLLLGEVPVSYEGPRTYAALKAAGVPMIGYGQFATTVVNFLILALAVYQLVRFAHRISPPKAEAPAGPSEEILLLREIRDALSNK